MLRNEADVVESFVRHNLALLDGLSVVDHGSSDATSEILNALVAEGLPLEVERDGSAGYLQSEIMSRTVRINPLMVLVSILVGASIGNWIGGFFGGFVAALLSIPAAGAVQVVLRAVWQSTASGPPPGRAPPAAALAAPTSPTASPRAARTRTS